MPTFSSIKQFKEYARQQLKETMSDEVSKFGEKTLTDAKINTIYSSPSEFATGGFLDATDSEVMSSQNIVQLSVFDNPNKMPPHPSWQPNVYGDNQNKWLSNWLEFGHGGMATIEGYRFYERAREEFEKNFKNEVIKGLKKRGIEAK